VCNENVATLTVAFRERAARSVKKVEKEKYWKLRKWELWCNDEDAFI